jgi:hypothetical protein
VEAKIELNDDRPTRENMPIEEATISNMWAMASIVKVLERKGLCTKQDLHAIIDELRNKNPRANAEVGANTRTMARPRPEKCCLMNPGKRAGVASPARS